jgi:hypothetical protein
MVSFQHLQDDLDHSGSKARQAILAGGEAARRDDAQKRFKSAWSRVDKEVAKLDELAPANRDGFAQLKQGLPDVRAAQQQAIHTAASNAW